MRKTLFCVLTSIAEIYTLFKKNISELDSSEDLKWWSLHHGVDMPMAWPTFEVSLAAVHSVSCTGTEVTPVPLCSFCSYLHKPGPCPSRWLAPLCGTGFLWHSDCSPGFFQTHSTLASKLFLLAV